MFWIVSYLGGARAVLKGFVEKTDSGILSLYNYDWFFAETWFYAVSLDLIIKLDLKVI